MTHPQLPSPPQLDRHGVCRQCITELTSLKCSFSADQQLTGKYPFPPRFKDFTSVRYWPRLEAGACQSPQKLRGWASSQLTETLEGRPSQVTYSLRAFAPHPQAAQRNGGAGTLQEGMGSLLALLPSSPFSLSWTTHRSTFSPKTSRKYSSQATAIIAQVSPATLAQAEGLPCLELSEAQG